MEIRDAILTAMYTRTLTYRLISSTYYDLMCNKLRALFTRSAGNLRLAGFRFCTVVKVYYAVGTMKINARSHRR